MLGAATSLNGDGAVFSPSREGDVSYVRIEIDGCTYSLALTDAATDYIQRQINETGLPYELAMLREMRTRLDPGDLVVDVGANIGNHSIFLAAVAGCRVVAFEPNTRLLQGLQSSIHANNLGPLVEVYAYAIGSVDGRGRFVQARPDNLGSQSIVPGAGEIEIRSLDGFGFTNVRALKIDVESMELEVLMGAAKLIAEQRPLVYVECWSPDAYDGVSDFLVPLDYDCWSTFNRTPTHLFCPSERATVATKVSRLLRHAGRETYSRHRLNQIWHRLNDLTVGRSAASEDSELVAEVRRLIEALEERPS